MSLEERLIKTLHRADDFEPSPDLFARMERSLEEDLRHRRRVRWVAASLVAGALAIAFFLRAVIAVSSEGRLTAPGWALILLTITGQVVLVLSLGPTLRRFGRPLIADVFRLDPATGDRFVALLDIAFYLFLFGAILVRVDLQAWNRTVILGDDAWEWTARFAVFLLAMGIAHVFIVGLLPLIGLFFSSIVRRDRRRRASAAAPPVSARALQAERVVRLIVWGIAGMAVIGTLAGVGVFLLVGVFRT
jgi:hypothetical protein